MTKKYLKKHNMGVRWGGEDLPFREQITILRSNINLILHWNRKQTRDAKKENPETDISMWILVYMIEIYHFNFLQSWHFK